MSEPSVGFGSSPPRDPERIGPYRIVRMIGRGGMGDVFLAEDTRTGAAVALKILPRMLAFRPRRVKRFLAEARACSSVDHPAIARVHDSGEVDGVHFIALEYVEGASLAEILQRRTMRGARPLAELLPPLFPDPLPPEARSAAKVAYFRDVARVIEQIARGLHRAHELGILHRDVKPSNILLHLDGRPRLADFGLARIEGGVPVTLTGEFVGTADYASPEQADPVHSTMGPFSDIFSLGATLFECVTGRPPFGTGLQFEVLRRIRTTPVTDPRSIDPEVPEPLSRIVLRCLEKPVAQRYASAAELGDDLGRFCRGEPVLARAVPQSLRVWRRARANAWRLLLASTATAAAVAIGALAISEVRSRASEARFDAEAKRVNARHMLDAGEVTEALKDLDAAVEGDRGDALGLALRSVALFTQDRCDDGERDLRAALGAGLDARFMLALEGPIPEFLDETVTPPDATVALQFLIGRRCMRERRFEDAVVWFRRSVSREHSLPDAHAWAAVALARLGRFADAAAAAAKYRGALRPVAPEYAIATALVAQSRGEFDAAIRSLDALTETLSTPFALRLRAECAIESFDALRECRCAVGDASMLPRAIDDLRRARSASSHDPILQLDLAGALARLAGATGDAEAEREASSLVDSILLREPANGDAHAVSGILAESRNRNRAISEFARARELEPSDPRWALAHASALLRSGAASDAAQACAQLVATVGSPSDDVAKRLAPFGCVVADAAAASAEADADRGAAIVLLEAAAARIPTPRVERQLGLLLAARAKTAPASDRADVDAAAAHLIAARRRGDDDARASVALLHLLTVRGAAGAKSGGVTIATLVGRTRDLGPPDLAAGESLDLACGLLRSGVVDARAAAFAALRRAHLDDPASVPVGLRTDVERFLAEWRR
ncbi:MAG: serine/threonine protein kinase [Planctomycetes bacterium]|nr:serine/threonine protein kinase [Planctomycetota bacterium]